MKFRHWIKKAQKIYVPRLLNTEYVNTRVGRTRSDEHLRLFYILINNDAIQYLMNKKYFFEEEKKCDLSHNYEVINQYVIQNNYPKQ